MTVTMPPGDTAMFEVLVEAHCAAVVTFLLLPSDRLAVAVMGVIWPIVVSSVFPRRVNLVTTAPAPAAAAVGAVGEVGSAPGPERPQPTSAARSTTKSRCSLIRE